MQIKKFEIDGKEVQFVNEHRNTRYGFAHDTHLFINGYEYKTATCHYLNRTWECYAFQSVMKQAVYLLEEERENRLRDEFKAEKGYKKLTAKRAEEFKAVVDADEQIKFYRKINEKLNEHRPLW